MKTPSQQPTPPGWAERFLCYYCHADLQEEILGDLYEAFLKNYHQHGLRKARYIFALHVILFFKWSNIRNITPYFPFIMWQNYFKTAMRLMVKYKVLTSLNILGMTIGIATSLLIFLWIQDELSFDKFHENDEQLYRFVRKIYSMADETITTNSVPCPLEKELEKNYPEVVGADVFSWEEQLIVAFGEKSYRESGRYVGDTFFEHFTYPFLLGNPTTALKDASGIVISERLAEKLFGSDWKDLEIYGTTISVVVEEYKDVVLEGVFENIPANATYQFDFALSEKVYAQENDWVKEWENNGYRMFVRLKEGTDVEAFNEKIKYIIREHVPNEEVDIFLTPYSEWHLRSWYENGVLVGGRIEYVRIFIFAGAFLLFIACINFMNLTTARYSQRIKEIGIRKTIGAQKFQLVSQFMVESILLTFLSVCLAIGLVVLLLPYFNELTGKAVSLPWQHPRIYIIFIGLVFGVGLISGSYPAFFLSGLPVFQMTKGGILPKTNMISVRRGLVVMQFVLANLLIISSFTCFRQIQYIKNKQLGYTKENLIHFPIEGELGNNYAAFKEKALNIPGILSLTAGGEVPTRIGRSTGGLSWEGKDPQQDYDIKVISSGYDYVETLRMQLIKGRAHSRAFSLDSAHLVVNETAAKLMGMEEPIGKKVELWGRKGEVIGLVKDFHFRSMYHPIKPLVIRLNEKGTWRVFARLSGDNIEKALFHLEKIYQEINPSYPFTYEFVDDDYKQSYRSETIIGKLAYYFTFIAICISCLGLFGLSMFAAERRQKEISIRKVMGASMPSLVMLLTKEFFLLVAIAFLVAIPIAWYIAYSWLSGFEYRISFGIGIFLWAGIGSLGIALFSVSYEAMKAALHNPVEALKSE